MKPVNRVDELLAPDKIVNYDLRGYGLPRCSNGILVIKRRSLPANRFLEATLFRFFATLDTMDSPTLRTTQKVCPKAQI